MVRKAASVVLHRDREGLEVYLVRRAPGLRFFGGWLAFPGGAVEREDRPGPSARAGDDAADERAFLACALREVEEETGLRLESESLVPAARFVTPRFSPVRFDTRFYLARCEEEPRLAGGELVEGRWWRPADALASWRRWEERLTPPCVAVLSALEREGLEEAAAALGAMPAEFEGSGVAIPWTAGYEILPLHCEPLPPELPTNAFLVGCGRFVLVDPGPQNAAAREHLLAAVARRLEDGDRLDAVVLTHHHVDHVGALDAVLERFDVPVWAHPITGELLSRRLDRELVEGDRIELGEDPGGCPGWALECLFTPGHAAGHLALRDERQRALIAGDLLSTAVSMYVGSPGGHLGTYLETLERLRALDIAVLYPSHGTPTFEVPELIDRTVRHRKLRLRQMEGLLSALPPGEGVEVEALAARIYADVPPEFREFYTRAARAALEYLAEQGRAEKVGEDVYTRRRAGAEGPG